MILEFFKPSKVLVLWLLIAATAAATGLARRHIGGARGLPGTPWHISQGNAAISSHRLVGHFDGG
jgi:hypothetical protein